MDRKTQCPKNSKIFKEKARGAFFWVSRRGGGRGRRGRAAAAALALATKTLTRVQVLETLLSLLGPTIVRSFLVGRYPLPLLAESPIFHAAHVARPFGCQKMTEIFKWPKNREDGSDLDDFWTKSIAPA